MKMKNETQKTKIKNNKRQNYQQKIIFFKKQKTMLGKDLGLQCQTPLYIVYSMS